MSYLCKREFLGDCSKCEQNHNGVCTCVHAGNVAGIKITSNGLTSLKSSRHKSDQNTTLQPSKSQIASWTWGPRPSKILILILSMVLSLLSHIFFLELKQLNSCLRSVLHEQKQLCTLAAGCAFSSIRFRQKLVVAQRYYISLARQVPVENHCVPLKSESNDECGSRENKGSVLLLVECFVILNPFTSFFTVFLFVVLTRPCRAPEKATLGLARVGSRAALSFAFAFLRRAWRSGEDSDLCSELLQESLDALRSLSEATLFNENNVSSVWLEVVDRASKFLRSVVLGYDCGYLELFSLELE